MCIPHKAKEKLNKAFSLQQRNLNAAKFKVEIRLRANFYYKKPCVLNKLHLSTYLCTPSGFSNTGHFDKASISVDLLLVPDDAGTSEASHRIVQSALFFFPPPIKKRLSLLRQPFFDTNLSNYLS